MTTPHIAVILTDAHRRILWVNEDFTDLTGYSLGEVFGKKPSILQGPRSEQDVIQRIRKALDHQVPIKDAITNYRKNGESYLCKLVIYPIFNPEQDLVNFIAFEVDEREVPDDSKLPIMQLNPKYSTSSLKGVDEMKLYYRLQEFVESEKLFLDANLSLKSVADQLGTNTKYLSQVVNHYAGCNFQHFINQFRVDAFKDHVESGEYRNLTLFGIAAKCGFKNKSTFYKVFKEICGKTPRDYQQEVLAAV